MWYQEILLPVSWLVWGDQTCQKIDLKWFTRTGSKPDSWQCQVWGYITKYNPSLQNKSNIYSTKNTVMGWFFREAQAL